MKLWLISQTDNNGYDTYSDAVVASETREEARLIIPCDDDTRITYCRAGCLYQVESWFDGSDDTLELWTYRKWAFNLEDVDVKLIGEALEHTEPGIVLASYHAG
jgi:hypothetical protein